MSPSREARRQVPIREAHSSVCIVFYGTVRPRVSCRNKICSSSAGGANVSGSGSARARPNWLAHAEPAHFAFVVASTPDRSVGKDEGGTVPYLGHETIPVRDKGSGGEARGRQSSSLEFCKRRTVVVELHLGARRSPFDVNSVYLKTGKPFRAALKSVLAHFRCKRTGVPPLRTGG